MENYFIKNQSAFLNLLYFFVILMVGLGFSQIKENFSITEYLSIVIVASIILFVSIFITGKVVDNSKNNELRIILDEYQSQVKLFESNWYYSMERLQHFEEKFKGYLVWVISEQLDYEHSESKFINIIKNNIEKRNINYEYIIPNNSSLQPSVQSVMETFTIKRPKIFVIKRDTFDYPSDILVFFNKHREEKIGYTVFMELIVSKDHKKRGWARIENGIGKTIVYKIENDKDKNKIKFKDSYVFVEGYC